ncbi:MAG: hypothetical protein HRT65_01860 [Flavobacteriaceae bacterium]|nr:hypothetical protein [Flavobacteriaceae bacterium]
MEKAKQAMIHALVTRIENQLNWGKGKDWSNKDFEELSELIFDATKKRLSVTTLKRIWGRAEMVAQPSSATLDILSEFVGFGNWREFVSTSAAQSRPSFKPVFPMALKWTAGVVVVIASILVYTSGFWKNQEEPSEERPAPNPDAFSFDGRVVSSGMPNSVVFHYDATQAIQGSKIEIQQDWDQRKRIEVSQHDTVATCIYYRPGYFKSKLVVDGTIVKEKDVFITTEGWLGVLQSDSVPRYMKNEQVDNGSLLGLDPKALQAMGVSPNATQLTTSLYHVADFEGLYADDFELTMQVRNTYDFIPGKCQEVEIVILYDGGAIGMGLAKKGCISNLDLFAFGDYVDGKKNDLSAFGVDFEDDIPVKVVSEGGKLFLYVGGQMAYEFENTEKKGIKGVSVHFEGTGSVSSLQLSNKESTKYVYPKKT